MRKDIFWKAEKLKYDVEMAGSVHGKEYYKINDVDVVLKTENKVTTFHNCTCKHCSVHGDKITNVLCSHKIAVLKAIPLGLIKCKKKN